MLFENVAQAKFYASSRPTYPDALYRRLVVAAAMTPRSTNPATTSVRHQQQPPEDPAAVLLRPHHHASSSSSSSYLLDVGCGTGQATVALADYFPNSKVIGMDPSASQLAQANKYHPRVVYCLGSETNLVSTLQKELLKEEKALSSSTIVGITAAQAAHWFDLPAFYDQIRQLVDCNHNNNKDQGNSKGPAPSFVALWTYGNMELTTNSSNENAKEVTRQLQQKIMVDLYEDLLGPYWDERRRHVENGYQDLPLFQHNDFVTERISTDDRLHIQRQWTATELLGYLRSWSAYATYSEKQQQQQKLRDDNVAVATTTTTTTTTSSDWQDPLKDLEEWIRVHKDALFNETDPTIQVTWPVTLLLSVRKQQR